MLLAWALRTIVTKKIDNNVQALIELALREDVGAGDVTSRALFDEHALGTAQVIAKESFILCGQDVAEKVCDIFDKHLRYFPQQEDGNLVEAKTIIATIEGPILSLFSVERTVLNFLQQLSGVSTLTSRFVRATNGKNVTILDTRKTTPGWRVLEKYAVKIGGGKNHRFGLYDAVLIKNNHLDLLAGDAELAVTKCRNAASKLTIEIEVRTLEELQKALRGDPDVILLDNMNVDEVRKAVTVIRKHKKQIIIEASGGINESTISQYVETGVDALSIGALTHSAKAVDISMRISTTS